MQSNDPNILAQCHFRTGPHGVSNSPSRDSGRGEGLAVMLMAVLRLQKRPIAVRGCTDLRKEGGERARPQNNGNKIEINNGWPIYGAN
jgi:hypothetical protein